MSLVFGQEQRVIPWVVSRIPHAPSGFGCCAAIGVAGQDGELRGGVVYHEYRVNDVQMSLAGNPGWLNRESIRAFFRYPFVQLGVDRVTCFVPARNTRTRAFCEKFGFTREGVIRRGFASNPAGGFERDDAIVYGLLREECKFLKEENHG